MGSRARLSSHGNGSPVPTRGAGVDALPRELPSLMTTKAAVPTRSHGANVSRMCPATDRKRAQEDGHLRSPKSLVRALSIRFAKLTKRLVSDC